MKLCWLLSDTGHLIGHKSIVDLLRRKGYTVDHLSVDERVNGYVLNTYMCVCLSTCMPHTQCVRVCVCVFNQLYLRGSGVKTTPTNKLLCLRRKVFLAQVCTCVQIERTHTVCIRSNFALREQALMQSLIMCQVHENTNNIKFFELRKTPLPATNRKRKEALQKLCFTIR